MILGLTCTYAPTLSGVVAEPETWPSPAVIVTVKLPRLGGLAGASALNTTLPLLPALGFVIRVETLGGAPCTVSVTLPVVPVRVSRTFTVIVDWF